VRSFESTLEQNKDGSPKVIQYIRVMELYCICILHAYMRIGEKIMNILLYELRGRVKLPWSERCKRWRALAAGVNRVLHGRPAALPPTDLQSPPAQVSSQSQPASSQTAVDMDSTDSKEDVPKGEEAAP
jgi:hypothetical protein